MKRIFSAVLCVLFLLTLLPVGILLDRQNQVSAASALMPDSLSLVGCGLPGIRDWDPGDRAGTMTQIESNVYEYVLDCPAGDIMQFKIIGNYQWDDRWNFGGAALMLNRWLPLTNGGGSADMRLAFTTDCTARIVVDLNGLQDGGNAMIYVEKVVLPTGLYDIGFKAPDTWQECYVYTWNSDGPTQEMDWPGRRMSLNEDGIWISGLSGVPENVLFNSGSGGLGQQTDDLKIPGDFRTVYVYDTGRWVHYNEAIGQRNLGIFSMSLMGSGLPGIPEWNPGSSAGKMRETADGVFTKTLDVTAGTSMTFRIVGNGDYTDMWDFAGAQIVLGQEAALSSRYDASDLELTVDEDCRLRFTVDINGMFDGGDPTLLVEKVTDYDPVPTRKLTVVPPASWQKVYAYTWEPEEYGNWPGLEIRFTDGVYCLAVPETLTNLVISGFHTDGFYHNTGAIELLNNGKNVTVTVREDCSYIVEYENTSRFEGPTSLAIVGSGIPGVREWDPADPAGDMTEVTSNVYEKMISFLSATTVSFKIAGNDQWDDAWNFGGASVIYGETVALECGPASSDISLVVEKGCVLKITVDLNPMITGGKATLKVENFSEPVGEYRKLTVVAPDTWVDAYVYTWEPESLGTYPGKKMAETQSGIYECMVSSNLENLIISGHLADGTTQMTEDIRLETGVRPVVVMLQKTMAYHVIYDNSPSDEDVYRVVGNADWMGAWDPASDLGLMEEISVGLYQKCFYDVRPGSYEFKITKNGTWNDATGNADGSNFAFTVTQRSQVIITWSFDAGDVFVTYDIVPITVGDVNGDGQANIGDMAKIYAHIRGTKLLEATALIPADYNGDGQINLGDVAVFYADLKKAPGK